MFAVNAENQSFSPFENLTEHPQQKSNLMTAQYSATVSSVTLYRLASVAGVGSALILLVNAAKRSSLIPTTDLTQILAPFAEILALGLVIGLFFAVGRRSGVFGMIALVMNFIALASLEGVEVVINLVFSQLPLTTITDLRAGPLEFVLVFSSMLFLLGSLAFVVSLVVGKGVPRVPLALYFIGVAPIALRAFVPEWALDIGLVTLAAAIVWLSGWLWMNATSVDNFQMGSANTRAP